MTAVFLGLPGAISAALGGLACVLPNGLFALRLKLLSKRDGTPPVTAFFVGEFIKVVSIVGLLALVGISQELEQLLGCPVDVAEPDSLHPLIRSEILQQAVGL